MGESELQIILAEYNRQQQRLQLSIETVNQTLNIYTGVIAFLIPVAAGTVAWTQQTYLLSLLLGIIALVAGVATFFTFIRSFQARMDQTNAERALSRLRNYFATNYSDINVYLSGSIYDDWPTPYTNQWQSASFMGWLAMIIVTGVFTGLSVYLFLTSANLTMQLWIWLIIPIGMGILATGICYLWLDRRLKGWQEADKKAQRFPHNKQNRS